MSLELLLGKLEGELTERQEADFRRWIQESDDNLRFYQKLMRLREEGEAYQLYKNIDVEKAWLEVIDKTANSQTSPSSTRPEAFRRRLLQYRMPLIAAAIVLLFATVALLFYVQSFSGELRKETGYGEKITFTLPDQSEVILNANSSLSYYKDQPRKVWLEGEAFFKVRKSLTSKDKFLVMTNDLTIEVLGTAFNVNSHQEKTKVSLEEGAIKLDLNSETIPDIFLEPGETLVYSKNDNSTYEKKKARTKLESSWKAGIQLFEKTPLPEILTKMEEIYGVNIQLKNDQLDERLMTMGMPVEDLTIALSTIENVLNIKIVQVDSMHYYIE